MFMVRLRTLLSVSVPYRPWTSYHTVIGFVTAHDMQVHVKHTAGENGVDCA